MDAGKGTCKECGKLMRLCGGLDFFPADIELRWLLVERLHRLAKDHPHAKAMIDHWLETQTVAPKVADLVGLAAEVKPAGSALPPGCANCEIAPGIWASWVTVERGGEFGSTRCACARGRALRAMDQRREQPSGRPGPRRVETAA